MKLVAELGIYTEDNNKQEQNNSVDPKLRERRKMHKNIEIRNQYEILNSTKGKQ